MNISGIRTQAGFYDYNTIKNSEVRSQQIREAKETGQETAQQPSGTQQKEQETAASAPVKRTEPDSGAVAFQQQYQPDATYELKGAESDLYSLDVEKAISDMKRDQVLQQYQFFVGESRAADSGMQNHDNENFLL